MTRACVAAVLLAAASLASASAASQVLRDPTEPPWGARPSPAAEPAAAAAGTNLQSVIVSQGRKLALIDGRMYRTGDKLGNAIVAAISEDRVTLRGPAGIKVLKLYENLKKPAASADRGRPGGKGDP